MATLYPTPVADSDWSSRPQSNSDVLHYDDTSTYDYYCYATPGTAASTAAWWVVRVAKDGSSVAHALQPGYQHAATSLVVVAALTYRS